MKREELRFLPHLAKEAATGMGDPAKAAELKADEVVLDIGCGAGIDTLLAAHRVGHRGKAIGIDMIPEALALAKANAEACSLKNAAFLGALAEALPFASSSMDAVFYNGVLDLCPDKEKVLKEAYRVLKPGGRVVACDMVLSGFLPKALKEDPLAWAG